MTWLIQRW